MPSFTGNGSEPGSPRGSPHKAVLWRVNNELKERNEELQREVLALRQAQQRRELARLSSVGVASRATSLAAEVSGATHDRLHHQLQEAQRIAAERAAALDRLQAVLDTVTAERAAAQQAAEELRSELGAAWACQAELQATLDQARTDLAEDVQLAAVGPAAGGAQAAQAAQAAASPVASAMTSPAVSELGPRQGQQGCAAAEHQVTCVYSVVLPGEAEEEAQRQQLEERIQALEAELAQQLAAKEAAQQQLSRKEEELMALHRERDLLQEQAMSLQQEVSACQHGSLLRGGASGAELALEPILERSPSRTLACRMRELMGLRRSPSPGASRSSSGAASPRVALPVLTEASQPAPTSAEVHQRLVAKEAELTQARAAAAAAEQELASAQQRYEASTQLMNSRMAAAEAAAEAVLQLHGSQVDPASPRAPDSPREEGTGSHRQCRATIEGIYAQMWRERLGRQKAQAEAVELRLKLSEQHAVAMASKDAELDEAVMQSLEQEMKRADNLADDLHRYKAHYLKLQKRVEQLELQLAEYNTLLTMSEGVMQLPSLGGSPPGSTSSRSGGSSPVRAAITALQVRKTAEEAATLREQLKAAQTEVASVRRRERESAAALKTALRSKRDLEEQQAALVSGLATVQRLLGKRALGSRACTSGSGSSTGRSPGAATGAESAMAALSALLRSLQTEDASTGSQAVVSPQQSAPCEALSSAGAELGQAAAAEKQSDPLDEQLDVDALLPDGMSGELGRSKVGLLAAAAHSCSTQDAGTDSIAALRPKRVPGDLLPMAVHAASTSSRIPAPPPAGAGPALRSSPAGSPSKASRVLGLRKLVLSSCGRMHPKATVSTGQEAATATAGQQPCVTDTIGLPAKKVWSTTSSPAKQDWSSTSSPAKQDWSSTSSPAK